MLEGLRVVELGVWVAGPSAAGLLADWGAEVVKVEAPAGDPMRRMLQLILGHGETRSPPFDLDNRGKRSVVADITDDEDRARVLDLIDTADVFVTNLRPDAVARLGLDPATLTERNDRLVYARVTGYGPDGPDAGRPGYDVSGFWARSGIAAAHVPPGVPPPNIRGGLGDHVTGLATLAGILGALWERERSGRGQVVDTSLLRTGMYCLGWDLSMHLQFGRVAPTLPRTEEINPLVNPYTAADGQMFWLLGVESQRHYPRLCDAVGRPELATDERFVDARARRHNAAKLIAILDDVFASRSRDDWAEVFDRHDVWWGPVNTPADAVDDPQAVAAGAIVAVPGGAFSEPHRAVASPVDFSRTPVGPAGPTPGLGEHTADYLSPP